MRKALLMFVVHLTPPGAGLRTGQDGGGTNFHVTVVQQPSDFQTFDNFLNSLRPGASGRWSELMLSGRRVMNSKVMAALLFIIVGGLFCTLLLDEGLLTRTAAIIVLHLGLCLSLVGAAFCFNLAGFNPTWMSYALFCVWSGLFVIAFFEFGWTHLVLAITLYVAYFQVGRLLSALFVRSLLRAFVQRERAG